jgi:Bacterial regulatory protein, Fis family
MSKTQTKSKSEKPKKPPPKSRRRIRAGWSIPGAAEELGVSYKTLREAIEREQVRVIPFGGLDWVPNSEIERLKEVWAA